MNETYSALINDKKIQQICSKLSDYKIKTKNNHMLFFFKFNDTYITIYKKKTILVQGKNVQNTLEFLELVQNKKYEFDNNFKYEIGSDETGTGDFFGGITVCAVRIDSNQFEYLKNKYNIDDSKKLTDEYILSIWNDLKNEVPHKLYSFSPREYNNMINEYQNANILKSILHNRVLKSVFEEHSKVIIDQFANETRYYEYLKKANLQKIVKINIFEIKAESKYLSVAIASIIARGWHLKMMEKLSSRVGLVLPLGASNEKIIQVGNLIVKTYSKNILYKICKLHFKTINELNLGNCDKNENIKLDK